MVSIRANETKEKTTSRNPLGNRDFRLMWIGESVSLLGDQFYLIALPWLVLQLTGDAFALGTVLALAGIPRALFMLIGGAITDRFSPRNVMLVSNVARMALVGILTALVLTEAIQIWMLYIFALAFGLADAFFYPAQSSIVPQILHDDGQLQAGNALVQGMAQVSLFLGPVLAGILIALVGGSSDAAAGVTPEISGIGLAFGIDALTFVASIAALWLMKVDKSQDVTGETSEETSVVGAVKEGLTYVWNDVTLRTLFLLIAAINFLIVGPFFVGVPVLADTRLPEGPAAFGIIMSAFGGGSLLGIILAAVLPKPAPQRMGILMILVISLMGVGLAVMGFVTSTAVAALAVLMMGAANGYVVILTVTWLQRRTPEAMLGRMMSIIMFASEGLVPVSQALSGALIQVNMMWLFVGAGVLMTAVTLWAGTIPALRAMGLETAHVDEPVSAADILRSTSELVAVARARRTSEVPAVRRTGELPIVG